MKIAISSTGNLPGSPLEQRFGRTPWFALVETDTLNLEVLENSAASSGGGAGISAAQLVIDRGAKAVVTGAMGPNAMEVFRAAGIAVYRGVDGSVLDNAAAFAKGELTAIENAAPAHSGMGAGKRP